MYSGTAANTKSADRSCWFKKSRNERQVNCAATEITLQRSVHATPAQSRRFAHTWSDTGADVQIEREFIDNLIVAKQHTHTYRNTESATSRVALYENSATCVCVCLNNVFGSVWEALTTYKKTHSCPWITSKGSLKLPITAISLCTTLGVGSSNGEHGEWGDWNWSQLGKEGSTRACYSMVVPCVCLRTVRMCMCERGARSHSRLYVYVYVENMMRCGGCMCASFADSSTNMAVGQLKSRPSGVEIASQTSYSPTPNTHTDLIALIHIHMLRANEWKRVIIVRIVYIQYAHTLSDKKAAKPKHKNKRAQHTILPPQWLDAPDLDRGTSSTGRSGR